MTPNYFTEDTCLYFLLEKKVYLVCLLLSVAIFLAGCGKSSEAEQLAELRDSFTYKQYRRVSEKGVPVGLRAYVASSVSLDIKEAPKVTPDNICVARLALAYAATVKKTYTIALVETDIVQASSDCKPEDRAIADSIRAIVFQNLKWPNLAIAESRKARASKDSLSGESFADRALILHLAFAYLHITEKEWKEAKFHIDGIAVLIEQPWVSKIGDFALAVHEKRLEDAIRIAQEISTDPSVPAEVRTYFAKIYADMGGDVARMATDPKFLAEMVSQILWSAAKESGSEQWKKISTFADGFDATKISAQTSGVIDNAMLKIKNAVKKEEKPDKEKTQGE
ncbi:MAG: hypothetical protein ACRERV_09980 [Methylococcales bacterium]